MDETPKQLGRYSIRASGRGFVVTLPQDWLDTHGLKAKDKLEIVDLGNGKLVLSTGAK